MLINRRIIHSVIEPLALTAVVEVSLMVYQKSLRATQEFSEVMEHLLNYVTHILVSALPQENVK